MATRVFELARELGVRSKEVLDKCRAEGLEIKNHMATLSAGLEATIREWFSDTGEDSGNAVETTEHVDMVEARARAKKTRRKKKADEEVSAELAEEPAVEAETPEAPAQEEPAPETPAPQEPVAAEAPETIPEEPAGEVEVAPAEVAAQVEEPTEAEPEPAEKPKEPEPPKPAGPQVVPRPATMKGPRIGRVERPDNISPPPRRRPPTAVGGGGATGTGPARRGRTKIAAAGDDKRKTQRRSPRRRGGRTADSGEKLKEWRDRDLVERSARLAAASGGHRRHRGGGGGSAGGLSIRTGPVAIEEPITVKSLSAATGIKSAHIIRKLMETGTMATVNQVIPTDLAEMAVAEYDIELSVRRARTAEEELLEQVSSREAGKKDPRAPVVTFLGHVDHGKTSLLDYIRHTAVASGEAGGITQHIGAYRYDDGDKHVVFLDTPGHEAFTAMRARGANMTDVVVLVVAADDGVMPQTIEAINHAKAAEVPIVVALNKIDVANANVQRAMGQLAEHDLQPREWGGDTEVIQTSAETGEGMDTLVETLNIEAELLELEAEKDAAAAGFVIESQMRPGLGVVARLLVKNGTLKIGDVLLAGAGYGRVRRMIDSQGRTIKESGPATPVEVSGLNEVPEAGDRFFVLEDIDQARAVAEDRKQRNRAKSLTSSKEMTLENLFSQIEAGEVNELPLIIKADVQGSVEAVSASLNKLSTDEVRVNILHSAVGGVSTGDVTLAEASKAIIIGFNVVPDANARQLSEKIGVDVRLYRVIYEAIDDVRKAMEEGLSPEVSEETTGHADVRQVFKVSRLGTIAGCYVTDGLAQRNAKVRIIRDSVIIEENRELDSLKRFKDDTREVRTGMECGLKIAGYDDIKEGDVLEFYKKVETARKL